jgi:hypothetical protein
MFSWQNKENTKMTIDPKVVEQLLIGYKKPEDMIGENGLLKQLTKALLEKALQAELTTHLGYEKHDPSGRNSGNSRNGATRKKLAGRLLPRFGPETQSAGAKNAFLVGCGYGLRLSVSA